MPLIPFPNVPQVSGVPALARAATQSASSNPLLTQISGILWQLLADRKIWGIYDQSGMPIIDFSINATSIGLVNQIITTIAQNYLSLGTLSTKSVEYAKETRVSDFPIERGSFATYNKAEVAATPVVTLNLSGSESDRTAFLSALDLACKSTALYSVVTPEVQYINYSIERYGYRRTASSGCTLLTVDVFLKEVRQVSARFVQTSNASDPSGKPAENGGKVQPSEAKGSL